MTVPLSVHRGSKVVLSLCVMRYPTRFVEPAFARKFREWKNQWEVRTGNKLNIADGLAYLRTPGHFLPSIEEREKRERLLASASDESKEAEARASKLNVREIDELLAGEGIPELAMRETTNTGESQNSLNTKKHEENSMDQTEAVEWLIVKYKSNPNVWTFPFTHRVERETAFTALMRVCKDQIGLKPHLPSLSPIAFREVTGHSNTDPITRMFFYKALKVPRSHEVTIPRNSEILTHEWVKRNELRKRLTSSSWYALENALPLD